MFYYIYWNKIIFLLGESALHFASAEEQLNTMKLLISLGCDINVRDHNGRTGNELCSLINNK